MGVLRVHGMPQSPNVLRVIAIINELGLDYEFVTVNLGVGEHKQPSFLSLNPFGEIPVLEDGDLKLFESRAITRYLVEKHRPELISVGGPAELVVLEVEAHQFSGPAGALVFEHLIKPMIGAVTDKDVVAEKAKALGNVLDVYEKRLAGHKYLAGDELTLVDLHHVPLLHYLTISPERDLVASRPNVLAWFEGLSARPAWKKTAEILAAAP